MTILAPTRPIIKPIEYPESDGQPMADNTRQFRYIMMIQGGLDALLQADPNAFVAGDFLWYPVEGDNKTRIAPDVMVVFGRPKGDRGSYCQWEEGDLAPQVVFEVLSPGNTTREMHEKFKFYERYGVAEYYLYDPDSGVLEGWTRTRGRLRPVDEMQGWVSPRLGVRFELERNELVLYRPDGQRFQTYVELAQQRNALAQQRDELAQQRDEAEARVARLLAQLRALGIKPEA